MKEYNKIMQLYNRNRLSKRPTRRTTVHDEGLPVHNEQLKGFLFILGIFGGGKWILTMFMMFYYVL